MEFLTGVDDEISVSRSLFNTEKKLVFDPLVYEQRYLKVCRILNHERFKQKLVSEHLFQILHIAINNHLQ